MKILNHETTTELLLAKANLAGKSYEENGSEIADASEDDVEPFELNTTEVVITNGKSGSSESKSNSHHSGRKGHDYSSKKGVKAGITVGENEPSNTFVTDSGKTDLATQLRATIAQKQMENEPGQSNRGDILHLMMGVLKEDVISIDGLGFDDKLPSDNLSHLQAIEFGKLLAT
ncbi:hypothetical protein Tco_0191610 [Tanacetum coccineum]